MEDMVTDARGKHHDAQGGHGDTHIADTNKKLPFPIIISFYNFQSLFKKMRIYLPLILSHLCTHTVFLLASLTSKTPWEN